MHQIDATAKACYKFLPPSKEKYFTEYDVTNLRHVYNLLYPQSEICTFGYFYFENKRMLINGEEYITTQSQSKCSSAIVAHWLGTLSIDEQGVSQEVSVGIVTAFIQHSIVVKEQSILVKKDNVLAHVKWFQDHPQRHSLHDSTIISANIFEIEGPISYIPVSRIFTRCAIAKTITYQFELQETICVNVPFIKVLLD